jgi:CRISPR/Cas system-associated protein endoribonuclease Cas2
MPPKKSTGYWLVTLKVKDCSGYSTRPIKQHPADYMTKHLMAKHLDDHGLIFAMPITKKQYAAMRKAYAGGT